MPELPIPAKYIYIFLGFIGVVFVVNVLLLDYFFVKQRGDLLDFQTRLAQLSDSFKILGGRLYTGTSGSQTNQTGQKPLTLQEALNPVNNAVCPTSCVDLIALSTNSGRVSTSNLISPYTVPTTTTTSTTTKGEFFVPLGSGTISSTGQWVDLYSVQGSFDTANYGSIKAFYFEVVMHIPSGGGELRAKLIDDSTPFTYDGQVLVTQSATGQLLSVAVPLLSGNKTYHIRLYSTVSSSGVLDSARIRIVTQ